ncbi:MAG: beta-galactosidase [Victivallales bacterium]|nr:beta-galactosidase [Victivallales bacterium]
MKTQLFFLLGALNVFAFGAEVKLTANEADDFIPQLEKQADGTLRMTSAKRYYSKRVLPVVPTGTYSLSGEFKLEKGSSPVTICYAVSQHTDRRRTLGMNICVVPGTETVLAAPTEKGATSIRVKDTSKWTRSPRFSYLVAFNADPSGKQSDLPNFDTSSYLGKFTPGNGFTEIELKAPLTKAYPEGTAVRLHIDRWCFGSCAGFLKLTEEWQKVQITINPAQNLPLQNPLEHTWWPGTVKARLLLTPWPVKAFPEGTAVLIRNLELKQLTDGTGIAAKPDVKFSAGAEWKAADMTELHVKAGSALDLSTVTAIPRKNGLLPRLVTGSHGKLAAADNPDVPIRLQGTHMYETDITGYYGTIMSKREVVEYVTSARRQGYNLIRFYMTDRLARARDMSINMDELDRVDYFVSEMGRHGIYMHFCICSFFNYLSRARLDSMNNTDRRLLIYLGDPELRKTFEYGATTLLNHVNPYTGRAWKDDPVIASIEFVNEIEAGFVSDGVSDEVLGKFTVKFRDWLKTKYQTPERLAKAWDDDSIKSFDQIQAPRPRLGVGDEYKGKVDLILFCNDLARDTFDFCENIVRKTGYKGLTSQYDISYWFAEGGVRFEKSQVALTHKYFCLPSNHVKAQGGTTCGQASAVENFSGNWRIAAATRIAGRPFFITEYCHCYWNKYQHEGGIIFGSYSALQGFDALVIFNSAVQSKKSRKQDLSAYSVFNNPILRAGGFLTSCFFLRGDVKKSDKLVSLEIPLESEKEFNTVSLEQSKIALLTGFAVDYKGLSQPQGCVAIKPDMVVPRIGSSRIFGYNWSIEIEDVKNAKDFSLPACLKQMKGKGIIPKTNISDPAKGIFQSDTGEIIMRVNDKVLKVCTPRSEAVTLEKGHSEKVKALDVVNSNVDACVGACSVDGKDLADSRRIVFIYSTEAANSGTIVSPDQVTMVKPGKLPVLLRVGQLESTLKNANGAKMSLYALGLDGSRREKLPLEYADGQLKIKLDTAKLKHGPTPFFELAAE